MDRSTIMRTGIAGAVAGLGLAVGGVALATAADDSPKKDDTQRHQFGERGHHVGGGMLASALADKLGVSQDKVEAALKAVMEDLRPQADKPPTTPPSDADREARQAAFAKALAKELGLSEAKVTKAFADLKADAEAKLGDVKAEMRTRLVERLDAAVKDGKLTEADKASVLKAYDAGVIGSGPGGPGFGGFRGHHGFGPNAPQLEKSASPSA